MVKAPSFIDKVVQHALVDDVLYELITRSFIKDNHAAQYSKGTHVGLDRLKFHMQDYFRKRKGKSEIARKQNGLPPLPMNEWNYADGWVLKADVRKFFASINHDVIKEKLKVKVKDERIYNLVCVYLEQSDGLPLGYQSSQILALLCLNDFDHWVKEKLHIKYYGRYMDDFYLIHEDKKYLQDCLKKINAYLSDLKLELNEKTNIFPLRNGIDFLGFHTYLTESGKVIRKLRRSSIKRMKNRIRKWEELYKAGLITKDNILASYQAWDAHASHGNTRELRKRMKQRLDNIFREDMQYGRDKA